MSVTKALIEMMEEMPFEDIKVKELCDRAMIRKSTFYKHFADKYELLAFIVKETINDQNERIRRDSPTDDPVAFYNKMLDYVFEFAKANQKLIAPRSGRTALCCVSGGKHTGTKRMIQNLSGLTRNPNSIQYERSPAASAAGVLSPHQKLTPPEKISAYFVNFCRQTGGAIL